MRDVMIDTETLGVEADAVILSIGAVKFDPNSDAIDDNAFYSAISIESNLRSQRHIDPDTLRWWLKQSREAQAVFFETKNSLRAVLTELSAWINNEDSCVWSNGADFDIPLLAHAYRTNDLKTPWKFFNNQCFRTYKKLPVAARTTMPAFVGVKHNAMMDAHHQARVVQAIRATMNNEAKMKGLQQ